MRTDFTVGSHGPSPTRETRAQKNRPPSAWPRRSENRAGGKAQPLGPGNLSVNQLAATGAFATERLATLLLARAAALRCTTPDLVALSIAEA